MHTLLKWTIWILKKYDIQTSQGKAVYGCSMKIVNDEGKTLPNDGKTFGGSW